MSWEIRTFLNTNSFNSDIKRVYYVIITEGKGSTHEKFC